MTDARKKEKLEPLTAILAIYIAIGTLLSLVKLLSERVWRFMYDTRPWYQRIFSDLDIVSILASIFTWPRYVYILITQGTDVFLRSLFTVWY